MQSEPFTPFAQAELNKIADAQDSNLEALSKAYDTCQGRIEYLNTAIKERKQRRRETAARALKSLLRLEIETQNDELRQLKGILKKISTQIYILVHKRNLDRASERGANDLWRESNKLQLESKIKGIPAKVTNGRSAKSQIVKKRFDSHFKAMEDIAKETEDRASTKMADDFLKSFDDILHAEITSSPAQKDDFLKLLVSEIQQLLK